MIIQSDSKPSMEITFPTSSKFPVTFPEKVNNGLNGHINSGTGNSDAVEVSSRGDGDDHNAKIRQTKDAGSEQILGLRKGIELHRDDVMKARDTPNSADDAAGALAAHELSDDSLESFEIKENDVMGSLQNGSICQGQVQAMENDSVEDGEILMDDIVDENLEKAVDDLEGNSNGDASQPKMENAKEKVDKADASFPDETLGHVSEDVKRALTALREKNTGVIIPQFSSPEENERNIELLLKVIEDRFIFERNSKMGNNALTHKGGALPKPVLYLVESIADCVRRHSAFTNLSKMKFWREQPSDPHLKELNHTEITENDAVIATGSSMVAVLGDRTHQLDEFSMIIFDRCDNARKPDHPYTSIVQDYYRVLPVEDRPRILAFGTENLTFSRRVLELNLNIEFSDQEVDSASRHFFCQAPLLFRASSQLAKTDIVFYRREATPAVLKDGYTSLLSKEEKRSLQRDQAECELMSDKDYLLSELGPLAVHLYQRCFQRRAIMKRWKETAGFACEVPDFSKNNFYVSPTDDKLLLGVTRKALTLFNELKNIFDSKSSPKRPSVVIHAGRPAIAIGLAELIKSFRGLANIRTSVVLGDTTVARSLETEKDGHDDLDFQGEETDDEAVGSFNCGEVDVLIMATQSMKTNRELKRPPSPSSVCIRFDGSATEPEIDGGGGHCRVLTFQPWVDPALGKRRHHSRNNTSEPFLAKRSAGFGALEDGKELKNCGSDSDDGDPKGGTKRSLEDFLHDSKEDVEEEPPCAKWIAQEAFNAHREHENRLLQNMRGSSAKRRKRDVRMEKEASHQAYAIKVVSPLRGPSPKHDIDTYVYLLTAMDCSGSTKVPMTGLQNFAVCLSGPLPNTEEIVHVAHAPDKPPFLRLLLIQQVKLTPDQIILARRYHSFLFSLVFSDTHPENFEWGPKDFAIRQYLILPVRKKEGNDVIEIDLESESEHDEDPFSKYFKPRSIAKKVISAKSALEYEINWENVEEALAFHGTRGHLFADKPDWDTATQLERMSVSRMSDMEGKLVFTNYTTQVLMSGSLRMDMSALLKFLTTVTFILDEKGYKKWYSLPGDRVHPLPRKDREEMELVKLYAKLEKSGIPESERGRLGDKITRALQKSRKGTTNFDPESNVKQQRRKYYENRPDTYEHHFVVRRRARVYDIAGPLLEATKLCPFDLSDFLDVSGGSHFKYCVESKIAGAPKSKDTTQHLLPEHVSICPVNEAAMFLPAVLMHLERHVTTCEIRERLQSEIGLSIPVNEFSKALTFATVDNSELSSNYERLELLGDSVLKLASTIRLFVNNPHKSEGWMHSERTEIVKNDTLTKLAQKFGLEHYLRMDRENLNDWKPPGRDRIVKHRSINDKSMADVMEALCGLFFVHGASLDRTKFLRPGYDKGVRFLEVTGVLKGSEPTDKDLLLSAIHSLHPDGSPPPKSADPEEWPKDDREERATSRIAKLESILGYRFIHKRLLLCALTHPSFVDELEPIENFQRLEFLGDAVLDLCVSKYLFERHPNLGPGMLTDLKGAAVQNETFARVTLEKGIEKFMYSKSEFLENAIKDYANMLKEEERLPSRDRAFWSLEVEAPKSLGDVFEAIAGAIFIDGGIEQAWRVFYKLLRSTLDERASPDTYMLNPVKELQELVTRTEKLSTRPPHLFVDGKERSSKMLTVVVSLHGVILAEGRGSTKRRAQCIAAEKALRKLLSSKEGKDNYRLWHTMKKLGWDERRGRSSN